MSVEQKQAVMARGVVDSYDTPWWNTAERKLCELGYEVSQAEFDGLPANALPSDYSETLEETLEEVRSTNPEQLVVLAHGAGGPIARHLTENREYTEHDALVTIQAFHDGTPAAVPFGYLLEGAESLTPDSDFMDSLDNERLSSEVDYVNIYTLNDPLIPDEESAKLPEAENVENIEVGKRPCEIVNRNFRNSAGVWTDIGKDLMRDFTEATETLFDSLTDPAAVFKKENRPRFVNPKMVGLRAGQLYHSYKVEEDELANSLHTTILRNDKAWDEIESHLN